MQETTKRIITILHKSVNGISMDEAEQQELEDWVARSAYHRVVFEEVSDPIKLEQEIREMMGCNSEILWNKIVKKTSGSAVTVSRAPGNMKKYLLAACLAIASIFPERISASILTKVKRLLK